MALTVAIASAMLALAVAHRAGAGSASPRAQSPSRGPCGVVSRPPSRVAHVIWIWMENRAYGEIVGSPAAPYINALVRACGLATNYAAVAHPSLPNYVAATSGGTWGIADDGPPAEHPLRVQSIFAQARSARSYEEAMPAACDLASSGEYAVKHNPEPYYTPVRAACAAGDVPLGTRTRGAFARALATGTLPAFSFVTPDLCHDMHDCPTQTGDAWLARWVPLITGSGSYRAGATVLFVTWDESDGAAGNQVATIVVSPSTRPGTRSAMPFDHYALLRTTEELLGITTYLGEAAHARSMRAAFDL